MTTTLDTDPDSLSASPETVRRLLAQRIVLFNGPLDDQNGLEVISGLTLLAHDDPDRDIRLWINSPGGSVPMMLAIADTIAAIPNDVATLALGWAASAGQYVLSMGTPGKRAALPHARILLHQGSSGIGGAAADVEVQADDLRHMRDTVLSEIARVSGQPVKQVFTDSLRDRWFTAEEAIEYGLCDHIARTEELVVPGRPAVGLNPGGAA